MKNTNEIYYCILLKCNDDMMNTRVTITITDELFLHKIRVTALKYKYEFGLVCKFKFGNPRPDVS